MREDTILSALDHGATRAQVATQVISGSDYRGRAALVSQLSKRLLKRPPDPAAASAFANQLGSGASEETALAELLSSDEYFRKS